MLFDATKNILPSDDILIQEINEGKESVFEKIYEKYSKALYNYLWNILNYNTQEAGLVLSDVFIEAFAYIQKHPPTNLKSLLYKIAHNTAIDWIRKNKHQQEALPRDIDAYIDPKDILYKENINKKYKKKLIQKYLAMLEPKYREVLYLLYYEDKSYDEIAILR